MAIPFSIDLKGKVAVVTGGGGILCSVMSKAIAECGAKVAVLDLRKEAADRVADEIRAAGGTAIGIACNVLVCIAVWISSYFLLYKTSFGLRLRACGEHPSAVASAGVNVHKMRYIGVLTSGFLSGLGGACILVTYAGEYNAGAGINGLGFLAIAALIFGQWKPLGILGSTAFFGLCMTIANIGRILPAFSGIPMAVLGAFPYVATLIALVFSSKKSAAPLASGQPF